MAEVVEIICHREGCNNKTPSVRHKYCSSYCFRKVYFRDWLDSADPAKVQDWRDRKKDKYLKRKLEAIEYLGGSCTRCGYNAFPGALHFHHIDPTTKDKSRNGNGSLVKWKNEDFWNEIKKCVLLCANCHAEIEGGFDA